MTLNTKQLMMGVGLVPLLLMLLLPVPKVVIGWGIGTYPLIVISVVAGMQLQMCQHIGLSLLSMVYPVVISFGLLFLGGAFEFYALGLVIGLLVDAVLLIQNQVTSAYLLWRSALVLLFLLLLYMIGGAGI